MRGSVYRRGRSWRAVIDLPRGESGKRCQRSATFATRRAAEDWLVRTAASIGALSHADAQRMSLRVYLDQWQEAIGPSLKPNTAHNVARAKARLLAELDGGMPLGRITPAVVQAAVHRLGTTHAAGTARRDLMWLRSAMKQAVAWGYLAQNPTSGVRPPRGAEPEMRCWNEVEAKAFLAAVEGRTRYALFFRLALATGMRAGEILGLRWRDVDWERGALRVVHSLSWPGKEPPQLLDPKTKGSRRVVWVDASTLATLRRHRDLQLRERDQCAGEWSDLDLVIATGQGGYVRLRDLWRVLSTAARRAGVPRIRIHDLRHTHGTLLLRQGRGVKEVADRLGHANPSMLLQRYAHVLPDQQADVARTIGQVLDGSGDLS